MGRYSKFAVASFLLLLMCFTPSENYKIMVYSAQISHSHVSFMGHIADTLAKAGHNVTVFIPEFVENVTTTGVKLARTVPRPRKFELPPGRHKEMHESYWEKDAESPFEMIKAMNTMASLMAQLCRQQLSDREMMEKMRAEKFDLGIGELFDPCSIAYIETIGVPAHISVFSMNIMELLSTPFGIDNNPSYVPGMFSPVTDEMSYLERAQNFVLSSVTRLLFLLVLQPKFEGMLRDCIGEDFDIQETAARSSFLFVNSEEFTEFLRPINHKVVFVGGIGAKPFQPLPLKYQTIMDEAIDGVVFISFGSIMRSAEMPARMKDSFVGAFKAFPKITFIWKYEEEDDVGKDLANLVKVKWAPQNDLFGHPKMRAFVSHAGLNSITEATHGGIPVITLPLFGDQMRNAKMAEKRGVGYIINKHNISIQTLSDAFRAVVYDPSYTARAKRLSAMIHGKPMSAEERVVKFSEFAAQFGHIDNLDPMARKLNFWQYYMLDVVLPALALLVFILFLIVKLLYCCIRRIASAVKVKTD